MKDVDGLRQKIQKLNTINNLLKERSEIIKSNLSESMKENEKLLNLINQQKVRINDYNTNQRHYDEVFYKEKIIQKEENI